MAWQLRTDFAGLFEVRVGRKRRGNALRAEQNSAKTGFSGVKTRLLLLWVAFLASIFVSIQNVFGNSLSAYLPSDGSDVPYFGLNGALTILESSFGSARSPSRITIAYAVSITACPLDGGRVRESLVDGAAVLHQSIRLASRQSKYGYKMIAFVHPDAQGCVEALKNLGYEIQIRLTPFNETEIQSQDLRDAQRNSCCGAKEYLKLYSYVLFEYPVVVHLDLDCLILKPLDDVFDLMLDPSFDRSRIPSMWLQPDEIPEKVDFLFTRDYGMVEPGHRKPHQIGVQGGFLVIRPNQTDFDRNVEIILSSGHFSGSDWGGELKGYGGYYGSGTIQGLASYYYGEFAQNRSVELNRCYYDTMVDNAYGDHVDKKTTCRTLEKECQDCREIHIKDIYSAHFTNCGKPFWCPNPTNWWHRQPEAEKQYRLCMELFREWHLVRLSLENEWVRKYPEYHPIYGAKPDTNTTEGFFLNFSLGHCELGGGYKPMTFPRLNSGDISLLPHELPHEVIFEGVFPPEKSEGGLANSMLSNTALQQENSIETIQAGTHASSPMSTATDVTAETTKVTHFTRATVPPASNKTKIAYAVSVTSCKLSSNLLDGGAVLHQSIRLASANSSYGYQMIAFVHPDATECAPHFLNLGYDVQIRDTPFNESAIPNPELVAAQRVSCCGAKEYIKLYSYVQHDFPIVVHLDLDTIVLKPMDDIFSLMLDPVFNRSRIDSMWLKPEEFPERIDFIFTRDYNMVDPPNKQPHQIGVQGGFLVVRPNETDFQKLVDIILSGGDFGGLSEWGGSKLGFGGYYGAGTIQGLASYYYGHFAKNRSLELNRCYYDAMVDDPMGKDMSRTDEDVKRCRTLEETCQDCRTVDINKIFTAHFTVCGKPYNCPNSHVPLCNKLHHEWHRTRFSLEKEWMNRFEGYIPAQVQNDNEDFTEGHCELDKQSRIYIPLKFPAKVNVTEDVEDLF